ncbi:MAG: hypothetical protein HQK65_19165 [Desulfamplus sp.]|nr:hypothetical protein [Desulfamplus sp.]
MLKEPRDEIKNFIKESLKAKLSTKDGGRHQERELNTVVETRAEELLKNFEKNLLIQEIKQIIIHDCKNELVAAGKHEKIIESIVVVATIILSLILFFLSFKAELPEIVIWLAMGCMFICLLQICLCIYLKIHK